MNRLRRRELARAGLQVVRAVVVCQDCGAPICPECGEETCVYECCGEFNCETCGHYVDVLLVSLP